MVMGSAESEFVGTFKFQAGFRVEGHSVLFRRESSGNVYHVSRRFLQDLMMLLTGCFRGLLSTLHRKGRSHVEFI